MNTYSHILLACLTAATMAVQPALAADSKVQTAQNKAVADIPHCVQKLGTISIANGDDPSGWTQYNLAPPEKLLKVIVQRSGCFNLVDRGTGLNAAERERDIGGDLGLQRGSNVGKGQVKAADYVLVAEVSAQNRNSAGGALAGIAGGMLGGTAGALLGGVKTRKLEANTVLSLTNVRTTETVAVEEGYATKTDVSWGAGGGAYFGGFAGAVGGGYEDTDIGRIVTIAFIDANSKLVSELGGLQPGAAEQAPTKTFVATAPVNLRKGPDASAASIRVLPVGSTVYPTGAKNGLWWEVSDENDNVGWVLNTKLAPAQ
jgi:hypothetical protein